jgi:ABC-type lipoprotein release transport system permease subunit
MDAALAWRNIWRNPRRTLILLTAVGIGVWSMIVLTAFMRGMVADLIENGIATLTGDVKIYANGYRSDPALENRIREPEALLSGLREILPPGAKIAARLRVPAVCQNARHSAGVSLVGIDPEMEAGVSFIGGGVSAGRMLHPTDSGGILVGRALLDEFETRVGNKLIVTSENDKNEIASRAFRIRGVYRAKLEQTEKRFVFVSRKAAQEMLGIGDGISEISVVLKDHERAEAVAAAVADALAPDLYSVEPWQELRPMLKAYIGVFDGFIVLWYLVVFAAMAFGIINTTLMAVFERMREFGLLKALGMRPLRILRSVLTESGLILGIGVSLGSGLALLFVLVLGRFGLDLSAFAAGFEYAGMSSVIRPAIALGDVVFANMVVIGLGLLVSAYPAVRAARIPPVEAMRRA